MDHEAYEKEMIEAVNRHSEEKSKGPKRTVITKKDASVLKIGLKRTLLALLTAGLFALAVYDFIAVATATGYWAVALFLAAIVLLIAVFTLLYAQGIIHVESKGDGK